LTKGTCSPVTVTQTRIGVPGNGGEDRTEVGMNMGMESEGEEGVGRPQPTSPLKPLLKHNGVAEY